MISYVCKYTPIEIFQCFDEETNRIEPSCCTFEKSDALMHPNMCAYSKAVLESCLDDNIDKLVLVNCCDSIKRLYDVLKHEKKFNFIYLMDLPHKNNKSSIIMLKNELTKLIASYEQFSFSKFDPNKLENLFSSHSSNEDFSKKSNSIKIAITGARCRQSIIDMIEKCGAKVCLNYTCTGIDRNLSLSSPYHDDILCQYAESLLHQYPCMRMANINERYKLLESNKDISGIIYHTVKFCDNYSFDYAKLKNLTDIPILKIETDYTKQCEGQLKTRIEAFIESLKNKFCEISISKCENTSAIKHDTIVAGIDSGSTSTNVVILNNHKEILSYSVMRTGAKSLDSALKAFEEALEKSGIKKENIDYIVSTGYGRVSIPFAQMNVTEITCHGKGAHYLNKDIRTIIDIGGQDSKVIRLDDKGEVIDFAMNDKCAAGTGRFLETMAKTLEISIDEMAKAYLGWREQISITSMCTVFAESEVVSLIAQNKNKSDIIHGLNNSISGRIISMLDRIGRKSAYMMSGGVAKNEGVVKCIEDKLSEKIFIPKEPEIVGALGAALIALEKVKDKY